ncbi:MAG: DNA-binding protein WhiA [Lachnospiraceae bacterium]|nr:DNA-binding protein WhiA [Lachnospiraceae bacterium]
MSGNVSSFSMEVKDELLKNTPKARHCAIAQTAVIIAGAGRITPDSLIVETDNVRIKEKYFTLLKKTFNINVDAFEEKGLFAVPVTQQDKVLEILQAVKILDATGMPNYYKGIIPDVLIKSGCCKREFLKCAFVFFGTINSPEKGSHLEFVCSNEEQANQVVRTLEYFNIKAKKTTRRNGRQHVVYLKDGEQIADFLRVVEANVATMKYEDKLIYREIANHINRTNNCEVANSQKKIDAAYKQIEDINYLNECIGLSNLPETLQCVALARLENPDVGLQELGRLMKPPLGKSGVNHRLRKISELAEKQRAKDA